MEPTRQLEVGAPTTWRGEEKQKVRKEQETRNPPPLQEAIAIAPTLTSGPATNLRSYL